MVRVMAFDSVCGVVSEELSRGRGRLEAGVSLGLRVRFRQDRYSGPSWGQHGLRGFGRGRGGVPEGSEWVSDG